MAIDRVSSTFLTQSGVNDILRTQREIGELQRQIGSQRKADDLKGFGGAAQSLISVRAMLGKSDAFIQANTEIEARLLVQDVAISRLSEAGARLRDKLTEALGLDSGTEISADLIGAFQESVTALNSTHAGLSLFGGERTDLDPVAISTMADLVALPSAADAFQNADRRQTARLDERTTIELAPLASELGTDLFASFKRIQEFDDGPNGPFGQPLTQAQRNFISGEIALLGAANEGVVARQATHGAQQARVEQAIERQRGQSTLLEQIAGGQVEVDLAEAASRVNSAQLQLEASASVFARLQSLTLLDFLR